MPTQLTMAHNGIITPEMMIAAEQENMDPVHIKCLVEQGEAVIIKNRVHNVRPLAVGEKLKTKVNANIGTSQAHPEIENEIEKLHRAISAGADAVMDLSTGGDLNAIREKILELSSVPVGTVPIYELMVSGKELAIDNYIDIIKRQAQQGVDFFTVHAGIKKEHLPYIEHRLMGVVSRGGAALTAYIKNTGRENPLYEYYDKILEVCLEYDVTVSLGDGLRPGCINDATDTAQIRELETLGELARRTRDAGVQVMIEGPGHIPLNQIKENLDLKKKYAGKTPFYVLGPLVTDLAAGHDHICGAIGGALAAYYGASFLCYVTPREHLGLPDPEDVREGVIASRIAAHAADLALGKKGFSEKDNRLSKARAEFDWETEFCMSIDPEKARARKESCKNADYRVCSMCGDYCSMKISQGI